MIKKLLKSKKGFTLIELIVGLVIFGIISTAVATLLAPTLFAFMRANDFAEYNILLDNLANQIISDLTQSTERPTPVLTNGSEQPDGTWNNVTITTPAARVRYTVAGTDNRGILVREINGDPQPVFTEDFYRRKLVSFKLEYADHIITEGIPADEIPPSYKLTVRLEHTNRDFEIQREYAVRPLILNQHSPLEDEDG